MPCLLGNHNNSRPLLDVIVLPLGSAKQAKSSSRWPADWTFRAVVDTGSTGTGITARAAKRIGLQAEGDRLVRGVAGVARLGRYNFEVGFSVPKTDQYDRGDADPVAMFRGVIYGFEFTTGYDYDVLLGMDIISTGSLKIEGKGAFSFSF